ncbi:Mitochondrial transcription termination factor family protein, putative [Theobroma cacao]|uniref:Mitochondrial transcription termination factor family protein, putative n=1 Tax=Theobroma cacao TaxID=3641 RepID=A0A061GDK1_THECC|nr:Mitochondrial transcription termination factor family protein, putative [Theobroma cacao]
MFMGRIRRRICKLSKMITHLDKFVVLSPIVYEKSDVVHNLCSVSLRVRYFRSSRLVFRPKASLADSIRSSSSGFASRISRAAKTEAQVVLFDYLHSTRSFRFMDAEHISKNSHHFLQNLLSKIDPEKDVAKSLTKFLRFNPVNEFEPFFESLGLSPSEVSTLVPQRLMFLRDDSVMLDNFHVLCDYGIPRSKMGKMYKVAREIFGYDYGVLALKLQAYENLGLSKPTVIKLVSCCPSLLVGGVDAEFAGALERLKVLGIKNDDIGGYLSGKGMYDWGRMLDMLNFLDRVGYNEEQLGNLFKTNPALLFEGSGKKVYVLFGRLIKLGLRMNEVHSLFMQNPHILSVKCTKNLFKALDFLFDIAMDTEDIAHIVSRHVELMGSCSLKGPKTVCRELNVEKEELCLIIKEDPLKWFSLASKSKVLSSGQVASKDTSKYLEKTTFLLRLGYLENSDEMLKALKQFRGRGDQLQERFDCLVCAGLDCNVVKNLIRHAPMVLNQSKDVIEKKIDCLKNWLGYPLESVVAFPAYLCYDMERISRRFSMYVWLRERGAAKPMLSLSTVLACSDARFVKYFVDVHPEGPAKWETLKKSLHSI